MINKAENLTILGYITYSLANYSMLNKSGINLINTSNASELGSLFDKRYLRIYFAKINKYAEMYIESGMPKDMYCDTNVNLCAKLARSTLFLLSKHSMLSEKAMEILIKLQDSKDSNIIFDLLTKDEYENIFASHFTIEIREIIEDRKNTEKK